MIKTNLSFKRKKINNKFFIDLACTLTILIIMLIIITNPKQFTSGTISGLKLFFNAVLPGLFPFMLLTKLLTEIGFLFKITTKFDKFSYKLFGTPGVSIYAFLMSILSGYPIGAKIISELYEKNLITENEAKKISIFCTTSGPIFVIGAVGIGMFKSMKIGLLLYFSHIISAIALGIIFNIFAKKSTPNKPSNITKKLLLNQNENIMFVAITNTVNSLFVVAAYITMFYLFTELLNTLKIIPFAINTLSPIFSKINISKNTLTGIVYGIFEVTRGALQLSLNITPTSISFCCGIISFSGISIIMQSMSFLKNCKIKTHTFLLTKCVHFVLSCLICLIFIIN